MPWTFAHPAAVLSLHRVGRLRLPLSGLVTGSLVPDAGYYVGCFELAAYAHTLSGFAFVCIPIALSLILLLSGFRLFLIAPLPDPHRMALERLPPATLWPLEHTARMIVAIAIGALTHIAWDAFTHANGAVVSAFAVLREEIFVFAGRSFAVYNVLQHVSTSLGLTLMGMAYLRWLMRAARSERGARSSGSREYMPLVVAATLSAAVGFAIALIKNGSESAYSVAIVRGVIYSTNAFIAAYSILAFRAVSRPASKRPG